MSHILLVLSVSLAFALIHSLCATNAIKGIIRGIFGDTFLRAFYRLFYTIFSTISVLISIYLISLIPDIVIWRASNPIRIIIYLIDISALVFGSLSFRKIDFFEFLGISQALRYIKGLSVDGDIEGLRVGFITDGVYGVVRHPLYLSGILIFLIQPTITRNWLIVQILGAGYFIYGAFMEERRLIARFGSEYLRYMEEVPRFIPRLSKILKKL